MNLKKFSGDISQASRVLRGGEVNLATHPPTQLTQTSHKYENSDFLNRSSP